MTKQNELLKRAAGITAVGIVAGLMLLFVAGAFSAKTASADNGPHKMGAGTPASTDRCAACHRAHTAKGKDYLFVNAASSVEAFCLTCHSGASSKTNVEDGTFTSQTTVLGARAGGFAYSIIEHTSITSNVGYVGGESPANSRLFSDYNIPLKTTPSAVTSKHNTEANGMIWGAGPIGTNNGGAATTSMLECTSCHDPHGNGQYRILRPEPAGHVGGTNRAAAVTVADNGCPTMTNWPYALVKSTRGTNGTAGPTNTYNVAGSCVNIPKTGAAAGTGNVASYGTTNYFQFDYVQPTECKSVTAANGSQTAVDGNFAANCQNSAGTALLTTGLSAWCAQCHQRYLAPGSSRNFASADSVYTYRHTAGGTVSTSGSNAGGSTRQCISCHLTHGSPSISGAAGTYTGDLGYPGGASSQTAPDNNRILKIDYRGVCLKCHGYEGIQ